MVKEYGGLGYREFRGDDVEEAFSVEDGLVMTAAVAEFEAVSTATR